MGTTVTYKLSITPEYELKFVSQPEVQDAHYVIYPITIKVMISYQQEVGRLLPMTRTM